MALKQWGHAVMVFWKRYRLRVWIFSWARVWKRYSCPARRAG